MIPRRRTAFTLVELLVVIAVIALLVSTLVPALAGARARTMQQAGQSNLRHLQIANALHADAHDARFLPGAIDIAPPPSVRPRENTHRWFGTRDTPSGLFRDDGPISAYLDGDATSAAVRTDPAFAGVLEDLARTGAGFERGCGGYGYNAAFVGAVRERDAQGRWNLARRTIGGKSRIVGDDTGARRSMFRAPARTIAFADCALATDRLLEYAFVEPAWWPNIPGFRPDPSIHFRHGSADGGRANIVWLDGHVSSETRTATQDSQFYPAKASTLGLGWFGDASSNDLFDYR